MVWLCFGKSIKLIRSGSAELDMDLCSKGSLANGMLPLCKLSPEVLGFKKKLNMDPFKKKKGSIKKSIKILESSKCHHIYNHCIVKYSLMNYTNP